VLLLARMLVCDIVLAGQGAEVCVLLDVGWPTSITWVLAACRTTAESQLLVCSTCDAQECLHVRCAECLALTHQQQHLLRVACMLAGWCKHTADRADAVCVHNCCATLRECPRIAETIQQNTN
jgi:hypothetical protein